MRFVIAALLATSASAEWGHWDSLNYCDFNQDEIGYQSFTAAEASMLGIDKQACADICVSIDASALDIPYGTDECCDYEAWSDGSVDCTLYRGDDTIVNDSFGTGNDYASMTFESGDYNFNALAAGTTKKEATKSLYGNWQGPCFKHNGKWWSGAPYATPVDTECGIHNCVPCPYRY